MELRDLYRQIKNPLSNLDTVRKIIDVYAKQDKGMGGFYGRLVRASQKNNSGRYNVNDADKFYASMFNMWKKSIVSMTKEEFLAQRSFGNDFVRMRNYLKGVPDVKTAQEVDDIIWANREDKVLMKALEKYRWDTFGENSGWVHVCSRYLTAKKDEYPNVEHRLYLNTDSSDTYNLVNCLVEKFNEHKIPFYFKFDTGGYRDDTVVIYSSTETLGEYIDILREIKNENPDLGSRLLEPPLLTGKIDGWIGYGSEPGELPDGGKQSFNDVRTKILEPIIDASTKEWIVNHRNTEIKYQNTMIPFKQYFAIKVVQQFVDRLERYYGYEKESRMRLAKKENRTFDETEVVDLMGYTIESIKNQDFKKRLFDALNVSIEDFIINLCNGKSISLEKFVIKGKNGKEVKMYEADLKEVLHEMASRIAKSDLSFVMSIQSQIKDTCPKHGIDENSFCFDIAAKNKIEQMNQNQTTKIDKVDSTEELVFDEEDKVLTADKVKGMLINKAREYYSNFGGNPLAIMNSINFSARLDYFVDRYFAPRVSLIIGEYVDALNNINGNVDKINEATEGLYDAYDELVENLREYVRPFFTFPPSGITINREDYIDSFLEELDDKGIDYLELLNKTVLEDALRKLEEMSEASGVKLGG
ncbi:MAG: T3SS effector HopA1 family protein [Bacilli bacterium]|nr:T3SS effector HopA1 family protein [Bacilli bacterium]